MEADLENPFVLLCDRRIGEPLASLSTRRISL
jgi:hypothetical protein